MLKVKKLDKNATIPTRAYQGDAGIDIYAIENQIIPPYEPQSITGIDEPVPMVMVEVRTGIAIEVPEGYYTEIACRSSLGKKGIRVHAGIIDSGYRNEITVWMQNFGSSQHIINKGDKVAQLIIKPVAVMDIQEVKKLSDSERGLKGHGSSGK